MHPRQAFACDLIEPSQFAPHVRFEKQDASAVHAYYDESFDVAASSLVLCYCENSTPSCGKVPASRSPAAHSSRRSSTPTVYRTGDTLGDGDFKIHTELSGRGAFAIEIGHSVGPLRYHYRPLPHYINAMIDAGWMIERVEDRFMDLEKYAASGVHEDGIARRTMCHLHVLALPQANPPLGSTSHRC